MAKILSSVAWSCGKFFPNAMKRYSLCLIRDRKVLRIKKKEEKIEFLFRKWKNFLSNSSSSEKRDATRGRGSHLSFNHGVKIWYRSRKRKRREREREGRKDGINGEHEVGQSGRCDIWSVARFKIHTVFSQPQLVRGFTAIEGRRRRRRRRNSDRFQRGCLFVVWFPFNDSRTTPRRWFGQALLQDGALTVCSS